MSDLQYQAKQPVSRLAPGGVANRVAGTADGVLTAMQQATLGMLAAGALVGAGRVVTRVVAASNAAAATYPKADYTCDGTADQVEINAALASLPAAGGVVLLSEGTFTLSGPIATTGTRQTLQGMGMGATTLIVVNAGGVGINTALITLGHDYAGVCDLTVDGNKANNATATSMVGVYVSAAARPTIQRVRMLNSAHDGITVDASAQNGIVRDCLVETPAATGFTLRSAALQRLVVSGCTAKGCVGSGFFMDNGPVALSACQALSCGAYGFNPASSALVSLTACTAQSCTLQGFYVTATRTKLTACRALTCVNAGFDTAGVQTQLLGCEAYGTTGNGHGFRISVGATDATFNGCAATSNIGSGFRHFSTGRSIFVGCRALANTQYGFSALDGFVVIRHCYVSGLGASSPYSGIALLGGAQHVVAGCRIVNNGGSGIIHDTLALSAQITNNFISDSSLATNGAYPHIMVSGDSAFVHGNMMRSPGSGNRPSYAIMLDSNANDTFIGYNDMAGAGTTAEVSDSGVSTKRMVRLALDYVAATDLMNGTTLPGGTWTDVCPAQTFAVRHKRNTIEIACRGMMIVGGAAAGTQIATRLVVDSTNYYIGGDVAENTTGQNPLAGAGPLKLQDRLAAGNHTVKLQVGVSAAAQGTLRAATYYEHLAIQVTEFVRQ